MINQLKKTYKTSLLVSHREKIIPVFLKDVAYFCLQNTLVQLCTHKNQAYFLNSSLDEVEKMLDPKLFYRANRQYIVSRNAISNAERFFSRKLAVKLTVETPESIIVSKIKAIEFLQWLEGEE